MSLIDDLAQLFVRFPGIGPRQSKRFVYFLLKQNPQYVRKLISLISDLSREIHVCSQCFQYFQSPTPQDVCRICQSPNRQKSVLLVVEKDADLDVVERSATYDGLYFVLGGSLPVMEENPQEKIRIQELKERIKNDGKSLQELILATSATAEGDHTAYFIKKQLDPLQKKFGFKITALGRGLSTGTELEYSDSETLKNALLGRK